MNKQPILPEAKQKWIARLNSELMYVEQQLSLMKSNKEHLLEGEDTNQRREAALQHIIQFIKAEILKHEVIELTI